MHMTWTPRCECCPGREFMNMMGKSLFQGSGADAPDGDDGAGAGAGAARHPLPLFQASDTGALLAFLPTPRDTPTSEMEERLRCAVNWSRC